MITSAHNPRIQAVRKLQSQAKKRQEEGVLVVEGVRLVEEALQAGWEAVQVFYTEKLDARGTSVVDGYVKQGAEVDLVTEAVMKTISETETPQGLLAIVKTKRSALPGSADFLLILDGVRDPGNLGTILRTCAAVNVQGVLLAPGNVDFTSPKVVRAGMGAHFRLPVLAMGWHEIRQAVKACHCESGVFLADSAGGIPYTQANFRSPLALIIGGEAAGAGHEAVSMANERVHIPMPGGSESLNAAIAASILLFEVVRQRGS